MCSTASKPLNTYALFSSLKKYLKDWNLRPFGSSTKITRRSCNPRSNFPNQLNKFKFRSENLHTSNHKNLVPTIQLLSPQIPENSTCENPQETNKINNWQQLNSLNQSPKSTLSLTCQTKSEKIWTLCIQYQKPFNEKPWYSYICFCITWEYYYSQWRGVDNELELLLR